MHRHKFHPLRRTTHRPVMITVLTITLAACHVCPMNAQDFTGTYALPSPDGPLTLSITQIASSVTGTLVGHDGTRYDVDGDIVFDEDVEIEGVLSTTGPAAEFTFGADDEGEGYFMLIVPFDGSGTPDLANALEFVAERQSDEAIDLDGAESGATSIPRIEPEGRTNGQPNQSTGQVDMQLVGVWATQVIMNTPGGTIATQMFIEFRADGVMVELGSRSMAGFPDAGLDSSGGGGETGLWRTEGNILYSALPGTPWVALAHYEVSDNRLFLRYYDGDQKIWYRQ